MKTRLIVIALLLSSTLSAQSREHILENLQYARHVDQFCEDESLSEELDEETTTNVLLEGPRVCDMTRSWQMVIEADPIAMGRYALGLQVKIADSLMLDMPVYYENSSAATPFNKWIGLSNANLDSYWGAGAGIGLKWRVSEWMMKGSFYLEPRLKVGYYSQNATGFVPPEFTAVSITPEFILGWERVFQTGFVIGASIGVEKLIAIKLQTLALPYVPSININPSMQVGYAW